MSTGGSSATLRSTHFFGHLYFLPLSEVRKGKRPTYNNHRKLSSPPGLFPEVVLSCTSGVSYFVVLTSLGPRPLVPNSEITVLET